MKNNKKTEDSAKSHGFFKETISLIESHFEKEVSQVVEYKLLRMLDTLKKRIMYGISATVILSFGFIFISVGVVMWLAERLPSWAAYWVIGIILLLSGIILMDKSKKHHQ